jgi:hypothetical protein
MTLTIIQLLQDQAHQSYRTDQSEILNDEERIAAVNRSLAAWGEEVDLQQVTATLPIPISNLDG